MLISLSKFNDLEVSRIPNFDDVCYTLLGDFEKKTPEQKRKCFASSAKGGGAYIHTSDLLPEAKGLILEIIPGLNKDFITCLFRPHAIFNSPGELIRAREDLIQMLESLSGSAPGRLCINDTVRGRKLFLQELGTQQLIDIARRKLGLALAKVGS
jgi:hypothetical protein